MYVRAGIYHTLLSVLVQAMAPMSGYSLRLLCWQSKLAEWAMLSSRKPMNRNGKIDFKSYDRFFPNQDTLPEGGLGNLVALPLQGQAAKLATVYL